MNPAPIKPLISTSDLDKIDVRVGTILAVEDVAHSENGSYGCVSISATTRSILVGMKRSGHLQSPTARSRRKPRHGPSFLA